MGKRTPKEGPQDAHSRCDLGSPEYRTGIEQASTEQRVFLDVLVFSCIFAFLGGCGAGRLGARG